MKNTLIKINELVQEGIIEKYAIGGGIAHFYYIEPSVTYDLDVIISLAFEENALTPLEEIYKWSKKNKYSSIEEHIIIENIPVQFLPAYNELVHEALKNANEITLYGVNTFILEPEYLMAVMLQTYRDKDRERLLKFLKEAEFSLKKFTNIIKRFNLFEKYEEFKSRYE